MDPKTHARFLDYRESHGYFGSTKPMLTAAEFTKLEAELALLEEIAEDRRTDEEEVRLAEVRALLYRD